MDAHELAMTASDAVATAAEATTGNVALGRSSEDDATGAGRGHDAAKNDVEVTDRASNEDEAALSQPAVEAEGAPANPDIAAKDEPMEVLATSLPSNSSLNSQSLDLQDGISTSPTSEGFSSQSTNPDGPLSQLSQLAAAQAPLSMSAGEPSGGGGEPLTVVTGSTAGQKRTADGQVKTPISPIRHPAGGHSRNASSVSNVSSAASSRLGDVSLIRLCT